MRTGRSVAARRDAVATAIRQRRRALEMGQAQLAGHLGTSQAHVCRIEHGQANPTLDTLLALEEVLGLQLLFLEPAQSASAARGVIDR